MPSQQRRFRTLSGVTLFSAGLFLLLHLIDLLTRYWTISALGYGIGDVIAYRGAGGDLTMDGDFGILVFGPLAVVAVGAVFYAVTMLGLRADAAWGRIIGLIGFLLGGAAHLIVGFFMMIVWLIGFDEGGGPVLAAVLSVILTLALLVVNVWWLVVAIRTPWGPKNHGAGAPHPQYAHGHDTYAQQAYAQQTYGQQGYGRPEDVPRPR